MTDREYYDSLNGEDKVFLAVGQAANLTDLDEDGEELEVVKEKLSADYSLSDDVGVEPEDVREALESVFGRDIPEIPESVETVADLVEWVSIQTAP